VSDTVLVRILLPALAAALLFASACASSRAIPPAHPGGAGPGGAVGTRTGSTLGASAASVALSLLGSPYRNGGTDPTGFDCSGLVQYVFGQAGLALPRSVREQMRLGTAVDDVEAGDLLFFAIDGRTVSHVAIAVDRDGFVHAPSARGVVREERLSADYWRRRFSGARRLREEF